MQKHLVISWGRERDIEGEGEGEGERLVSERNPFDHSMVLIYFCSEGHFFSLSFI